jgi:CDP-diacylglycerol--glycerol-3-phosphate 3-phosphatidyltransferase
MEMLKRLPMAMVWARLPMGAAILLLALFGGGAYPAWACALLICGLVLDIFDGILARRLGVSDRTMRRLDSNIDQFFYLATIAAAWIRYPGFFLSHLPGLIALAGSEAATYLVCYVRFRKEIATHSLGSKLWALILVATLAQITLTGTSGILFALCVGVGILTRLEVIAIILVLKEWANDVPNLRQALAARRGEAMRRSKLFNG